MKNEKAEKWVNIISTLVGIIAILGVIFNKETIMIYPEYRKRIVFLGIVWIVSGILRVVWKKGVDGGKFNAYIRRNKLEHYIYAIIIILNSVVLATIFIEWLKYSIYPPALKITESDMFYTVVYAYEEEEKVLYPKVYEIGKNEENPTAYMEFMITNEINQSVSIESIQMNILNYKYEKNLFMFARSVNAGGDGELSDHVYHTKLDVDKRYKKMDYCGDYTLDDIDENYVFEPVLSHVSINGNETDFFDITFSTENSGIYTFEIEINYVVNGERRSQKTRTYQLYFPTASEINSQGSFDLLDQSSEEAGYLYERTKNDYAHPIVLSRKMDECVRTLKDLYSVAEPPVAATGDSTQIQGRYDLKDFEGYYYFGVDEETLNENEGMNPEVMELYVDEDGRLKGYRGCYFPTAGSEIYTYNSFQINGATLICQYSTISNCGKERVENGEHRFQLTRDGNLIENQEIWFKRVDSQ